MADGTWFAGDHPRSGDWETLEGRMLAPHTQTPMESGNTGDARFNGTTPTTHAWTADVLVTTGMTRGGGTMAK